MKYDVDFPERLETVLRSVTQTPVRVEVYPADSGPQAYFGSLWSREFEGMIHGARQRMVWGRILADLDGRDQDRVAYVYAYAPSELRDSELTAPASAGTAAPAPSE